MLGYFNDMTISASFFLPAAWPQHRSLEFYFTICVASSTRFNIHLNAFFVLSFGGWLLVLFSKFMIFLYFIISLFIFVIISSVLINDCCYLSGCMYHSSGIHAGCTDALSMRVVVDYFGFLVTALLAFSSAVFGVSSLGKY